MSTWYFIHPHTGRILWHGPYSAYREYRKQVIDHHVSIGWKRSFGERVMDKSTIVWPAESPE